jgi:Sulfotransferase family
MQRWYRRLRFGRPIVVVSGLPRSGTSMMMRMLHAGGVPTLTDASREADASNPHGYFEFGPTKDMARDPDRRWLRRARGRAVKLVSPLLEHLPGGHTYRIIFMERDLGEVIASQNAMLARRGEPSTLASDAEVRTMYEAHLATARRLIAAHPDMMSLTVRYADVLAHPLDEARRIAGFLGRPLDHAAMAAAVDRNLRTGLRETP